MSKSTLQKEKKVSVTKLTRLALFAALALAIYGIESLIPPIVPIPGIKPGLANIITLIVLKNYSGRDALLVLITRIIISSLLFGQMMSLLYSLAGGILCLFIMLLLNCLFDGHFIFITSAAGAVSHNIGQLAVAVFITRTIGVWSYLPFLILSGMITGFFTGLCASAAQRLLIKTLK